MEKYDITEVRERGSGILPPGDSSRKNRLSESRKTVTKYRIKELELP